MRDKEIYNEIKLLSRIAESDTSAFRDVFDHYRNKIFSIAYKLLKDETLAQDTVQEVFVKVWIHRKKMQDIRNFNAYINTITRNHLFNQLKKVAYAEKFVSQMENMPQVTTGSSAESIEFKELASRLEIFVNKLPHQQKKVYQLGKEEGLSYDEIASQLHISKETVKTHMSMALRFIRSQLHKH